MNDDLLDENPRPKRREDLNMAGGILAMGIASIVLALFTGGLIGLSALVLGILALVKGRQAASLYKDYPHQFTISSLNRVRAGMVCGIIGLVVWVLLGILRVVVFIQWGI